MSLNKKQLKIFSRQLILNNFNEAKQKILLNSHITFVGLWGVNIPALIYLLAAGVKNITLIDYDIIEFSNLNRQVIFNEGNIGEKKVLTVKKYIKKNYSNINISIYNKKINANNCKKFLRKKSLIIDGTDNWDSMLAINDHCVINNIPLLSASVIGYDGNFVLFKNKKNIHLCLRCIFPNSEDFNLPRCENVGILGTTAGIIGVVSAHKIIKYLTEKKTNGIKSVITYFDGQNIEFKDIEIYKNKNCINYKKWKL